MHELIIIICATLIAGLAMAFGALIARFEHIRPQWLEDEFRHSVMAFGGGALLSAVALVLIPDGIEHLSKTSVCLWFVAGGISFMLLDIVLYKLNTPASQLAAMLSDFIPESLALGAAFAIGNDTGYLLAVLIALQNVPEGFSAFRELSERSAYSAKKIVWSITAMALLGPIAGVSGYIWLGDQPALLGIIMVFASGGILYSIFQDLAPQAKLENHWFPPMGAVLGFMFGLLGFMLSHG